MSDSLIGRTHRASSLFNHSLLRAIHRFMDPFFSRRSRRAPHGWSDPALLATTLLMAWSDSSTITDRFNWSRRLVAGALPVRAGIGQTYQGFIKALMSRPDAMLPSVQSHLRTQVRRIAGDHWLCEGWLAFTVDGAEIDCPRTLANEEFFGIAARKGSGPQQQLTSIMHMGTTLPWAWLSGGACVPERTHLRDMLDLLPKGALLVADAGFTGYDLLSTLQAKGFHFLIRVGANVTLLTDLGFDVQEKKSTVSLWPSHHRDRPPLVLRLIRLKQRGGRRMVLLTNVLESTRLSRRQARSLYHQRWGVEVFYRSFKQTLERRKMRSDAPRQAQLELHSVMIALTLLGLMSVSGLIARRVAASRCSIAAALRVVRQCMGGCRMSVRTLWQRLARAEVDPYERKRSKSARSWPHKKNEPPPGEPTVRAATPREVRRAKRLAARLGLT